MKKKFVFTSIHVLLVFLYCGAQPINSTRLEEIKKQVEANNGIYLQAFAKGDSSIFINCYTKDCWIMQPNAPTLCGAEAPLDFFRTAYKKIGVRGGRFITIEIFGDGEKFVTEAGFWQLLGADNKLLDSGKYLVLWKNTSEGWKRFRDCFNSDRDK